MEIRKIKAVDRSEWMRMRNALWPDSESDHQSYTQRFLDQPDDRLVTLVMERQTGGLGAFLEAGWRNFAENCETSPVAYVEGWFVDPDLRGRGIGRALVQAAEEWALSRGMQEIASDAELDNEASIKAHQALGYEITGKIVCFRKRLGMSKLS